MGRKIGETFEYKGKTYKVAKFDGCANCAFRDINCSSLKSIIGNCIDLHDDVNVKFEEIKKDMEIKGNKLTINIPDGMEIDIKNSDLKNGIIEFKKKGITYEDIEASLDLEGNRTGIPVDDSNAFKLCAINRLMCIAKFYNGDWKPDWDDSEESKYYIYRVRGSYDISVASVRSFSVVIFKKKEDAQAVIDNPHFREILDAIFKN